MPLVAAAALAYVAGLLLGFGGRLAVAWLAAALGAVVALRHREALPAALGALVAAGSVLAAETSRRDDHCRRLAAADSVWRARLVEDARPGSLVRAVATPESGCRVTLSLAVGRGSAPAGALVETRGWAVGGRRGILVRDAAIRTSESPGAAARLRGRAVRAIDRMFGADAPLVRALLVADMRGLPPELRERYATAGLVHVLSVSGLHVGIIAAALALALQAARVPRRTALAASVVATAVYVTVIGAPPAAVRAGAMLAADTLSRLLQRPTSPWAFLALGSLAPLVDPRTVLELGYQLSVAGMAALLAAGELGRRLLAPRLSGWRRELVQGLIASTLATLATAPLVAWNFGRVSLIGPITNLLAAPLVALLQPTLFLALLLAPWQALGALAADAAHPLLVLLDGLATAGAGVPYASLPVAPTLAAAWLGAAAAVGVLLAAAGPAVGPALVAAGGALALLVWLPLLPTGSGRAELHMLDVGQGDAIALRSPGGAWLLVDAGRVWRGGDAGRRVVIPHMRRRGGPLAALVLSHPHADHVGGAPSVLRALRPRQLWDVGFAGESDAYRATLAAAESLGVEWRRVRPGEEIRLDSLELRFLAPDSVWTAALTDPNLASAVALVRVGTVRFLLVGDAERAEEAWLLGRAPDHLRADVLKVGHHGSATSSSPAFLAAVRPRIALVSVGAGNSYGHPDPGVLRALARSGALVLRTDELGSVVVRTDGRTIEVIADGEAWEFSTASAPR